MSLDDLHLGLSVDTPDGMGRVCGLRFTDDSHELSEQDVFVEVWFAPTAHRSAVRLSYHLDAVQLVRMGW